MLTGSRWIGTVAVLGALGCGDDASATNDAGTHTGGDHDAAAPAADAGDGSLMGCDPLTQLDAVLQTYGSAWNEPDAAARDCLIARSMSENAIYVDPTIDARGNAALSEAIGKFLAAMPGAELLPTGTPEARARDLRFTWDFQVSGAGGFPGMDYAVLAQDGRIAAIHGYWEPFPDGVPDGKPASGAASAARAAVAAYVAAWNAAGDADRNAALSDGSTDGVRFIEAVQDIEGTSALAGVIATARAAGLETATATKFQQYAATHARVQLELQNGAGKTTTVTDYVRFDAEGKIEHVGRFAEP